MVSVCNKLNVCVCPASHALCDATARFWWERRGRGRGAATGRPGCELGQTPLEDWGLGRPAQNRMATCLYCFQMFLFLNTSLPIPAMGVLSPKSFIGLCQVSGPFSHPCPFSHLLSFHTFTPFWPFRTGQHYAKWNKPGGEGQIPHDLTFNWSINNKRKK